MLYMDNLRSKQPTRTREMRACLVDTQTGIACSHAHVALLQRNSTGVSMQHTQCSHVKAPRTSAWLRSARSLHVRNHGHGFGGHAGIQHDPQNRINMPKRNSRKTKTHPTPLRSSRARERRGCHESRRRSAEGSRNSERVHHDIVRKFTLKG